MISKAAVEQRLGRYLSYAVRLVRYRHPCYNSELTAWVGGWGLLLRLLC